MVKKRAYEGDAAAINTLNICLDTVCRLLAPVCPFMTDEIYRELYKKEIHKEEMPSPNKEYDSKLTELTEKIIEFNSMVWKAKKDKGISLNTEISGIKLPKELEPFEDDLRKMHQLK
jgi:valyl-tRNA synthetase